AGAVRHRAPTGSGRRRRRPLTTRRPVPELLLRVRHGPEPDAAVTDVAVDLEASHSVAELAAALAEHLGCAGEPALASVRLGRVLDPHEPVGRADLLAGDELLLGAGVQHLPSAPGVPSVPGDLPDAAIDVVAGPESGRSWLVRRPGRYPVGRGRGAAVRLADGSVSRRHATV